MTWQLEVAEQRFDEMVHRALTEGPQIVTRHGEEVVIVLSAAEFQRLSELQLDFKEFLMAGPDWGALNLGCRTDLPREVDL